jgi:hypothetical protein
MRRILIALLLLPASAVPGYCGQAESDRQSTFPPDVTLKVRVRGNQSVFQIGEVIPLELSFTSSTPNKYRLEMATYDRTGRLSIQSFAVQPLSGWEDPLGSYFHYFQPGFAGGPLIATALSTAPAVIQLELNEWVRFKSPGQYRVAVKSARVSKLGPRLEIPGDVVRTSSNELVLTIVPATEAWQLRTLQQALAILDGPAEATGNYENRLDTQRPAVKALRYLGTAAAAREMARRLLPNERNWADDYRLGLIASPVREAALDEMRALLADPDFPVSGLFLNTMSIIALPADAAGDVRAQRKELDTRFQQELFTALGTKRNEALTVSKDTVSRR